MSEKSRLINKLITNKTTRHAYIWSKVTTNVASQIRALRRRRANMTQQTLAQEVEMKQSRISAMERPGTRFNIETLVRLAAAFKVGLVVKFVPFSEMLKWENGYSQDAFNPQTIDKDTDFQRQVSHAVAAVAQVLNAEVLSTEAAQEIQFDFTPSRSQAAILEPSQFGLNCLPLGTSVVAQPQVLRLVQNYTKTGEAELPLPPAEWSAKWLALEMDTSILENRAPIFDQRVN